MKKTTLLTIAITISLLSFAQKNKTDKEGKRTGNWKIYYELKENREYYDPLRLLPNWINSIKETTNQSKAVLFEKVKYKDGQKDGDFTIHLNEKRTGNKNMGVVVVENVTYYPKIVKGNYNNGILSGKLSIFNVKNETKIATIDYENDKPKDQSLTFSNQTIRHPGNGNVSYKFKEEFIFKGGYLTTVNILDEKLPQRSIKTKSGWLIYKYTQKPYCFNNFSFLSKKEIKNNKSKSLIDLNTNNLALEVYKTDTKGELNGTYKLYQTGKTFLDTTHLSVKLNFQNGLRNGTALFWDVKRDGHTNTPFIKVTYKNDKLHGESILYYSSLGKPAAKMSFENGLLKGKLISWWDADKHHPFVGKNIATRWTNKGGILMPYQVGTFNSDIFESIEEFQKKGNQMETPKGYFRFSEQNYIIDSIYDKKSNTYVRYSKVTGNYSWRSSENKVIYYWVIDGKGEVKDFAIMDKNGKNIMTMSGMTETINKNLEEKRKKEEELLNTVVKCEYCNGSVKIRDAVITWGGCDCFQDNNDKIGIYGTVSTYFCSQKCRVDYEKECCRRNGYSYEKY